MKNLTPSLIAVLIGLTILLFMAFKNDAPKKEYAILTSSGINWHLYKFGEERIKVSASGNFEASQVEILNNLAKEGWELKSTAAMGVNASVIELYLERVKP